MHKKFLVGLVLLFSAALGLGACGSQPAQPATQSTAATQSTEQVQPADQAYPSPMEGQQVGESPYPQPGSGDAQAAGSPVGSLFAALASAGLSATSGGDVPESIFSVAGKVYLLGGEELQVYEYPSPETAAEDAGNVSADGGSIGTKSLAWISTPHFFHSGNVIVVYLGENQAVLQALQSVLGAQFAGG